MEAIRQYVLSAVCITVICGLVQMIFPSDKRSVINFVTGLIIMVVVIAPVLSVDELSFDAMFEQICTDGEWAVKEGQEAAMQTSSVFIKEKVETYISNRAAQMGADVSAVVTLEPEPPLAPKEITLKGTVSPYVKQQLGACIEKELGIAEENQLWISQN